MSRHGWKWIRLEMIYGSDPACTALHWALVLQADSVGQNGSGHLWLGWRCVSFGTSALDCHELQYLSGQPREGLV